MAVQFNLQTKFEISGFIQRYGLGPKYRNGSPDNDHLHLGDSHVTRLILLVANLCTKFEVSNVAIAEIYFRGCKILKHTT